MNKPYIINEITNRIERAEKGSVFVAADFSDIAENKKIATILARIENSGMIRRVIRGIYEKPDFNEFLEEYIAPSPNNVAKAIARNFGWTIVPCGDTALNALGLSTQIPTVWLYVSDGPYKSYSFDNTTIEFKHTTNKDISKFSYKTSLIIQALKALGKENIDDSVIAKLRSLLTDKEKTEMVFEAKTATAWTYEYIKTICRDKTDEKNCNYQ